MRFRFGPWTLAVALIAICGLVVGGIWWRRSAAPQPVASMVAHMPTGLGAIIGIDVRALRNGGVLDRIAGPRDLEQLEYRSFVDLTAFDYRAHLDYALIGVGDVSNYFLLRGRFDWSPILKYAELAGGACTYGFCRLRSDSGREISYFAQRSDVLAMAVGRDSWGASNIAGSRNQQLAQLPPDAQIWIAVLKPMLMNPNSAPGKVREMLLPLKDAESALLTVNAQGDSFEVRLRVDCPSVSSAVALEGRLLEAAQTLRAAATDAAKPANPAGLAEALAYGKVSTKDKQVETVWVVGSGFLDAVLGNGG